MMAGLSRWIITNTMKEAYYRWIPCWFDPTTFELIGQNWFYDQLIHINVWIDFEILGLDELPIYYKDNE